VHLFLQGLLIGLAISAPVGPIGLLCIRRSIRDGRLAGLCTGLGAATADALYGLAAALGVSAITSLLLHHARAIQLIGGIFLLFLGLHVVRSRIVTDEGKPAHTRSLASAYFSSLALTFANPVTLIALLGIFSALGIGFSTPGREWSAGLLVTGVFLGACAWWLLLSSGASRIAGRINATVLHVANCVAGGAIIAVGLYELVQLALQL
jgi:threonine/homoserine/homoserine lactone efflux protein